MSERLILPGTLSRVAFAFLSATGVTLMLADRSLFPEWLFPGLTAFGCLLFATVLVVLPLVFRAEERTSSKVRCRARLQRFLAAGFLLSMGGTLGLYRLHLFGFDYDKLLHLVLPVLGTIAVAHFVHAWYGSTRREALGRGVGIVLVASVLWELVELASDVLLGTSAFGQGGRLLVADTSLDLALDLCGIGIGVLYMTSGEKRWYCPPADQGQHP